MQTSNILKHENKAKATWISICTFLRLVVLVFIGKNGIVFEGLIRAATPFGSNLAQRIR
jgi:hypothetical protein